MIQDLRRAFALLCPADAAIEVRVLGAGAEYGVLAGTFDPDHLDTLVTHVTAADRLPGANTYATINPVSDTRIARSTPNRLERHATKLAGDGDVVARRIILIDLDPVRPSGIASTDVEHAAALARAEDVATFLVDDLGVPTGAIVHVDTGNGAALFLRVDLPNSAESLALVKRVLAALDLRFSDDLVTIDRSVCNAARIGRLAGTTNRKGTATVDRPHRRSRLVKVPDSVETCPTEILTGLGATVEIDDAARSHSSPPEDRHGFGSEFDVDRWITDFCPEAHGPHDWNGGRKWVLSICPWNPEHRNRAAYIVQHRSGAISSGCHHNGCRGKGWFDLRELREPGYQAFPSRGQSRAPLGGSRRGSTANAAISPSARGNRIVLVDLSTVDPRRVRWAQKGLIPLGSVTALIGQPGQGKSSIMYDLVARLTHGTVDGDLFGTPARAAIATAEDVLDSVAVPRLMAAGADRSLIEAITVAYDDERMLDLAPETLQELRAVLTDRGVKLLVFDPLASYIPGEVDSHRDAAIRRVLAPLARLAEDLDLAVLVVIHLNKSTSTDPLTRICGSIAFGAAARSVLLVGQEPESESEEESDTSDALLTRGQVVVHAKCNYGPKTASRRFRIVEHSVPSAEGCIRTSRVVWGDDAPGIRAEDLLRERDGGGRKATAIKDVMAFLKRILVDGPLAAAEGERRCEAAGFTTATVRRAKTALGVVTQSVRSSGGLVAHWEWRLPSAKDVRGERQHPDAGENDVLDEDWDYGSVRSGPSTCSSPVREHLDSGEAVSDQIHYVDPDAQMSIWTPTEHLEAAAEDGGEAEAADRPKSTR